MGSACDGNNADTAYTYISFKGVVPSSRYPYTASGGYAGACRSLAAVPAAEFTRLPTGGGWAFTVAQPNSATALMQVLDRVCVRVCVCAQACKLACTSACTCVHSPCTCQRPSHL